MFNLFQNLMLWLYKRSTSIYRILSYPIIINKNNNYNFQIQIKLKTKTIFQVIL